MPILSVMVEEGQPAHAPCMQVDDAVEAVERDVAAILRHGQFEQLLDLADDLGVLAVRLGMADRARPAVDRGVDRRLAGLEMDPIAPRITAA